MDTEIYIKHVEPSQELLACLTLIPTTLSANYTKLPKKVVWSMVASITILICMNFIALNEYNSSTYSALEPIELIDSYFSYLTQLEL
jgi:hypothetical protein